MDVYLSPPMMHQCLRGGLQWLSMAAVHEAVGHRVAISQPCPFCGQRLALHACPVGLVTTPVLVIRSKPVPWLPILKTIVSAECPACGVAIDVCDVIANDPQATPEERAAASGISAGVAVVGGIFLVGTLAAWLAGRSRAA